MNFKTYAIALAMTALAAPTAVSALPGQNVADVVAAIHAKPFSTQRIKSEMSGLPMWNATARYQGGKVLYHIEDAQGHISFQELVSYDAPEFSFVKRADPRVRGVLSLVYSAAIAQDYLTAHQVAVVPTYQSKQTISFFRGSRYAYATGSTGVTIYARKDLAEQIKIAKQCATKECGD
ncbi:MAG: hypothetical protein M3N19_02485 [Candidatus Eremiobacteraeota bacterium]|nr:hypothetical protein [Candidatus Eremiobacteraeota bacterium]